MQLLQTRDMQPKIVLFTFNSFKTPDLIPKIRSAVEGAMFLVVRTSRYKYEEMKLNKTKVSQNNWLYCSNTFERACDYFGVAQSALKRIIIVRHCKNFPLITVILSVRLKEVGITLRYL